MAVMTPSEVRNGNLGQFRGKFVDFAVGTYASNGVAVSPKSFGFNTLLACFVVGGNAAAAGYVAVYLPSTGKLVLYRGAGGTVTGNAVVSGGGGGEAMTLNPDSASGTLTKAAATNRTIPIATLLGGTLSVAAAAGAEVPNGTNLDAVTIRLLGFGY